jgi:mRNA-degrading endonuclease RelE of RelBE toxin-antitoxin system
VAQVVIRREVWEEGELDSVPRMQLKEALRRLERDSAAGKALGRELKGCRSIRLGGSENRLIYRILEGDVVEVLAIGRRRDQEVHQVARLRQGDV